jgi:hypothetical protein
LNFDAEIPLEKGRSLKDQCGVSIITGCLDTAESETKITVLPAVSVGYSGIDTQLSLSITILKAYCPGISNSLLI